MAPVTEFSMKLIPPRLIPLVENHLKDLKKRGQVSSFLWLPLKKNGLVVFVFVAKFGLKMDSFCAESCSIIEDWNKN